MTISNKIKRFREDKGISQTELAKKVGTTKQTIYKYENGLINNIPSDKIEIMARLFDTTPQYLMGWEDLPTAEYKNQEIIDFINENPEMKTAFSTACNADLTPKQKASVAAAMIAHVKALKDINN